MAESSSATNIKVGLLVLASAAILVTASIWIAGTGLAVGNRRSVDVLMTDSGGIQAGDGVRLAGVVIGRVSSVHLDPEAEWPVVFRVSLPESFPLRRDTGAVISTAGILGTGFLQLVPGTSDAPLLQEGEVIRGTVGMDMGSILSRVDQLSGKVILLLDDTSALLNQVSGEIGPLLTRVENMLSDENVANISGILDSLKRTTEEAGPRVTELLVRLEGVADQLESGLEGMPELTSRLSEMTADIHAALGEDGARLAALLTTGEKTLTSADQALSLVGGNRRELESILANLEDAAASMKAFSQQLKERPYSLVRIKPEADRRPGEGGAGGRR